MARLLNIPAFALPAAMLCIGYPTPQQRRRAKPVRLGRPWLVHENQYQTSDPSALAAMHHQRQPAGGFPKAVHAIHSRKWASPFMAEMNRSASVWIRRWLEGTERRD